MLPHPDERNRMKWEHCVDYEWFKARQDHLTASEIVKLVPFTKTGRARTVSDDDRLAIMAKKWANIDPDDCWSTGAAARGHILEPYAIEAYNQMVDEGGYSMPRLVHWDDQLIYDDSVKDPRGSLAFSPDALDVLPPTQGVSLPFSSFSPSAIREPRALGEVKCYGDDRHILTACADKMLLEERWQIATGMAVCPTIDDGYLILYNPRMRLRKLYVIHYTRAELAKELDIVEQVHEDWVALLGAENDESRGKTWVTTPDRMVYTGGMDEDAIVDELKKKGQFNP